MTELAPAGWPAIRPGGYAVVDPESGKIPRLAYFVQSHRAGEVPHPWPRPTRSRTGAENREYARRVVHAIDADPVKARAVFAAFTDRCAVCCQYLDVESHRANAMHPACSGRIATERVASYRNHVQQVRALVAAGELDPGPPAAPPPPVNNRRAAYVR